MTASQAGLVQQTPNWYADPTGRHHYRYFDGMQWTDQVADDGNTSVDPVESPRPEPTEPLQMLSMDAAIGRCLRRYADFSGRAQRSEYWWFALFANLTVLGALFTGMFVTGGLVDSETAPTVVGYVLYTLTFFALVLPILAAAVRRLHDTGRAGVTLLMALIPVVGAILVLVYLTSPGTPAANQYGPPPQADAPADKPLLALAAAVRIPAIMGLLVAVGWTAANTERAVAIRGSYWTAWLGLLVAGAVFAAVLVIGRGTVRSRWVLGLEGAAAAVFALAPQTPNGYPWLLTGWLDRRADILVASGLLQVLAMVWFGIVAASAYHLWKQSRTPQLPAD
jgi:uncharacterized membrane protein YhaH (DUF805 family)